MVESSAREGLSRSTLLGDEWESWFGANRKNIEAVVNLDSGYFTGSPDPAGPSPNP